MKINYSHGLTKYEDLTFEVSKKLMQNTLGIDSYNSNINSWNELSDEIISIIKRVDYERYLLEYEINSSWWASFVFFKWGQNLAAKYFEWKVNRKTEKAFNIYKIKEK